MMQKVTIDVCKIYGPDAVFLQQAAYLTGGAYIYLERRDALLQHLLVRHGFLLSKLDQLIDNYQMTFLPPPSIRRLLVVPTQDKVDFRAACFCHKTIVDIGFVCSVCLSSKLCFFSVWCRRMTCPLFLLDSFLPAHSCLFNMPVCCLLTCI